ncbi:hypothetical protein ACSXCX_15695 (plasmid) [Clostridium perfringens]
MLFILYSNSQKVYFLEKDSYYEWIQFNINGLLVILGAFATILAVLMTINHSEYKEHKEIENKKRKIKIILSNEIEMLFSFYESRIWIEFLHGVKCSNFISIEGKEITPIKNEWYNLDNDFKDYIYELLNLAEDNEIEEVKEVLNLYIAHKNHLAFLNQESIEKREDKERFRTFLTCRKFFSDSLKKIWNEKNNIEDKYLDDEFNYIREKTTYNIEAANKLIKEFNNGKVHYSNEISRIQKYLNEK